MSTKTQTMMMHEKAEVAHCNHFIRSVVFIMLYKNRILNFVIVIFFNYLFRILASYKVLHLHYLVLLNLKLKNINNRHIPRFQWYSCANMLCLFIV